LRIDFLARSRGSDPEAAVECWVAGQGARIAQFREVVERARGEGQVSAPMIAQIASQARILLAR
jgi:glutamate dehydrogenase